MNGVGQAWLTRLRKPCAVLAFAVAASVSLPAQEIAPEVRLLSRIRDHQREELSHLPDYTCTETIRRFRKGAKPNDVLKPFDTVRLEVLFAEGHELYGAPGARRFTTDPSQFVGSGLIGTGIFATWLRTLFIDNYAVFTWRGEEQIAGQRSVRWDFRVPMMYSGYTITVAGISGKSGFKGSFWADPETLDLLQLVVDAEDIAFGVPAMEVNNSVTYARMLVGDRAALLPQTAIMRLLPMTFEEERNYLEFTHCQAFHAESSLSFGPPSDSASAQGPKFAVAAAPVQALPAGLVVTLALVTPIGGKDLVGSPISARVLAPVRHKGRVTIAEGAIVHGRIRRLEHYEDQGGYFVVGLEFTDVEPGGFTFYADLQEVETSAGAERELRKSTTERTVVRNGWQEKTTTNHIWIYDLPGVGTFFVRGNRLNLPAGLKTVWKTVNGR